ncbi:DUF6153 family protein [Rhodococcus sp. NPDC078407]|uniref:DUF6153 family protein n=1 Tax=Rhodococcus sp. NPDC078407 TaxID=3364509 RepID=UPI0037C99698
MHSAQWRGRRGTAPATGLLIALTLFGVLLMHSVTPMSTSVSGGHASMASHMDDAVPLMAGEHDCPSGHQMMHPCVGTTVSWPALSVPATSAAIDLAAPPVDRTVGSADSTLERAPPWTLWELDRSVTLRV